MTYKSKKAADKIARLHIVHTLKRYSTHSIAYNARFCKGVLKIRMRFFTFFTKNPRSARICPLGKRFPRVRPAEFPRDNFPFGHKTCLKMLYAKYAAKWGVQIVEMIFQTRSGERRERKFGAQQ